MNEKILVCLGFEDTIINGDLNRLRMLDTEPAVINSGVILDGKPIDKESTQSNPSYKEAEVVNMAEDLISINGFKNPEQLKKLFDASFEQGHDIAITSFTKYPDVIKPTLKLLGLSDEQLSKIHVVGGSPSSGENSHDGKKEHIDAAMKVVGIAEGDYNKVMLIDGNKSCINAANDLGMKTALVPKDIHFHSSYLNEAMNFGKETQTGFEVTQTSEQMNSSTKPLNSAKDLDNITSKQEFTEKIKGFIKNIGNKLEQLGGIIKRSFFKEESSLENKSSEKAPKENDRTPSRIENNPSKTSISQLDDKTKEEIRGAATKGVEIDSSQKNDIIKSSAAINSKTEESARAR